MGQNAPVAGAAQGRSPRRVASAAASLDPGGFARDQVSVGIDVHVVWIEHERGLISFDGNVVRNTCGKGAAAHLHAGDAGAPDIVDAPHLDGQARPFRLEPHKFGPDAELDSSVRVGVHVRSFVRRQGQPDPVGHEGISRVLVGQPAAEDVHRGRA